jgi:hypothetical protein
VAVKVGEYGDGPEAAISNPLSFLIGGRCGSLIKQAKGVFQSLTN